jgi:hypothetical protein
LEEEAEEGEDPAVTSSSHQCVLLSLFFPTYFKCYPSPGKLHPTTWKRMRSEDQDSNTANICQNMGGASRGKKRQRNFKVNSQIISEEDASTFMKKSDKIEKERY